MSFKYFILFSVYACFACIPICVSSAHSSQGGQKRAWGASGAGVIAGCKPSLEYRKWNWGTWQEQPGLLTTVPSLQIIQCLAL